MINERFSPLQIDFAIHNPLEPRPSVLSGRQDELIHLDSTVMNDFINRSHQSMCNCDGSKACVQFYRRYRSKHLVYHSLLYTKRGSSISFFIHYSEDGEPDLFGSVEVYFSCTDKKYALINHYEAKSLFTDYFVSSRYHPHLLTATNAYFHVLHQTSTHQKIVLVERIKSMCIVFHFSDSYVVTPVSSSYEHD